MTTYRGLYEIHLLWLVTEQTEISKHLTLHFFQKSYSHNKYLSTKNYIFVRLFTVNLINIIQRNRYFVFSKTP